MPTAAAVWVDVLPSLRGFPGQLNKDLTGMGAAAGKQLSAEMGDSLQHNISGSVAGTGTKAGTRVADDLGGAVSRQLPRSMQGASRAFDSFYERTAARAQSAGGQVSSAMSGAMLSVLSPIGRVRDGFSSAEVAASAFSGRAGTIGGSLRRGFDIGATAATGFGSAATGVLNRVAVGGEGWASRAGAVLTHPFTMASGALASFGISGGLALGGLAAAAATVGVRFNATQEQARIAFTTMLGSGDRAVRMIDELNAFAARTPFELNNVTQSAQRLMAYGFRADQVIPTLTAIGDAVSGLGGSAAQLDQVTTAVGQMMAKGKVQGDEILQLTEAGIPALRILANQYGVNAEQMSDMISKGQVVADVAIPKLLEGMQRGTQGAAGATQAFGGMMEQQSRTLLGTWSNFTDNFQRTMGRLFEPIMPGLQAGLNAMTGLMGQLPGVLDTVGSGFSTLWSYMQPTVSVLTGPIVWGFQQIGSLLSATVGPAIDWVSGLLRDHKILLTMIGAFLGAWVTTLVVTQGAILGVRLALGAWAAAQWLVNAAMSANPFGLVVAGIAALVAGVIYAYNNFEWFRNLVNTVWDALKVGAAAVWTGLQAAFTGIQIGISAVGGFFTWLWTGVVVPAWNGIVAAASWAWWTILKPIFDAIWFGVRFLGAVFFTLLVVPAKLAFDGLALAAGWLWDVALRPVFDWIKLGLRSVGDFFGWVWTVLIKPAWDAFGAGIAWVYENVILRIWRGLQWELGLVGQFFGWVWTTLIKPAWDALGIGIAWVWTSIIQPAWNALRIALDALGQFFGWVWNSVIKPAWDALGNGIRWVTDTLIRPAFDAVKDALHWVGVAFENVSNWIGDAWGRVRDFAAKPVGFVVNTVYNAGIRPVWNWIQDKFGLNLPLPEQTVAFAGGGVLGGYAPGRDTIPAMLSPGEAVLTPEAVRYLGPSTILGLNSRLSGRKPASGGGTVHAAGGWLSDIWSKAVSVAGGVWGGIKDVGRAIADLTAKPMEWIRGQLAPFTDGLAQFGNAPFVRALSEMPRRFIDAAVDKVTGWFASGGYGATPVGDVGGGVQRWSGLVLQALGMMGQPASLLNVVLRRMNQESGGNPNAINLWDSNAIKGTPSIGLMQTIGPTFAAYRDPRAPNNIYDPLANLLASMHYALARYGSLASAYNKPGGYRDGGWLMPGELAFNETRRPEPILSAEQWDNVRRMAQHGGGNTITVNAKTDADPDHIAHTIDRRVSMSARL